MKLLMFSQNLDKGSARLGFTHDWVEEFAKHCESLIVVCLYKGKIDLPKNVKVLSLGKDKGECKIKYLFNFYKYIWQERKNYDSVFVHMNAIYVVLGGLFWKIQKKKIGLWYVHRAVPLSLRIAEKFANIIFSASQTGFNLKTKKLKVLGHGIDLQKFKFINISPSLSKERLGEVDVFKIIYVGRISKIKNQELLLRALNILVNKKCVQGIKMEIVGEARTQDDRKYKNNLEIYLKENNLESLVDFVGAVDFNDIVKYYQKADLSLNLCPTGGMDKAVLESLACGLPVVVLNQAFKNILKDFRDLVILDNENEEDLSERILGIKNLGGDERRELKIKLRKVAKGFSLENLIKNILDNLKL